MHGSIGKSAYLIIALPATMLICQKVYPQKMPKAFFRAEAALELNQTMDALAWADSCFNSKPYRYQYYLVKGKALLQANRYGEAVDVFLQAEKQRAGIASYHLARTYCLMSDTVNCIEWTRLNLQSIYREPESSYLLDNDFKFAYSIKEWQKIWDTEWYSSIERDIHYARYLISNQNYDEAIELLNKRIKSQRSKAELFELRGRAHLHAGNFSLALKDFENAYHRSKRNYGYMALQAEALYNLNQNRKALIKIEQAIDKSGGKPEYLQQKAKILSKLNRWSDAYETLKEYLVYYPNNTEANLHLARYAYESGYYTDALLAIAKMLKLAPDNVELILLRGKIYLKTDQPRQAIIDFEKAIGQNYNTAESYLLKGLALLKEGEREEACKCFSISGSLGNIDAQGVFYNTCKR